MAARVSNSVVRIEGLVELRASLKRLERADELKQVMKALKRGAEIVAEDARRRVPSRTGRTRSSIQATSGGSAAYVTGGKKLVRHYAWFDFGSRTPKKGNPRSVGPWKGSGLGPPKGRFLYPALDDKRDEVAAEVQRGIDEAIAAEGL